MDFHDVHFEGKTWDIVRFRLDEDGILYGIAFHEVNEEPASKSCTTTDKTYETIRKAQTKGLPKTLIRPEQKHKH